MERTARPHEEAKVETFRKDPAYAAEYLNAVLADGDQEEVMVTLRYLAQAFSGVSGLAEKTDLNATTLYRTRVQFQLQVPAGGIDGLGEQVDDVDRALAAGLNHAGQ